MQDDHITVCSTNYKQKIYSSTTNARNYKNLTFGSNNSSDPKGMLSSSEEELASLMSSFSNAVSITLRPNVRASVIFGISSASFCSCDFS